MPEQGLVDFGIVQRKDGLYALPLSYSWRNACTAELLGPTDEVIDGQDVFGLIVSLDHCILVPSGMIGRDPIQPVLDPTLD